jgi:predicted AlkP superfamily phosphohydrolase/phosphomutase/tetratricopeptide (TPR) repeat protein
MEAKAARKVLLIGWDAADWKVATPLIEAGKMPNLKRFMDSGCHGRISTLQPILSPMLWTSIATGKRAWKHGIHGFSEPCLKTRSIRPISSLSRKCRAIWNILTLEGLTSQVVAWWPSHPAEPINGLMVSNHFHRAVTGVDRAWPIVPGSVFPESLGQALAELRIHPAELGNEHILPFIPDAATIDQERDKRMEKCAKTLAETLSVHSIATECLEKEPWDFAAVYLDGIDHFGHGFMRYHPPQREDISDKDFALYRHVMEAAYRTHDMMLGRCLQLAGPDATVMLISDHGFEPGSLRPLSNPNEPAGPAAEHSPYGIFCLSGPGIRKGVQITGASILDVTPTLLHLFALPVGEDMDGKVLKECFTEDVVINTIHSWEDVAGEDGRHPPEMTGDPKHGRESVRQLVELGYIEEPDPDFSKATDETLRELHYNLAQAYADGGRLLKAAEIFRTLWDRWPRESRFGVHLLRCVLRLPDASSSRAVFEELVRRKDKAVALARAELEEYRAREQSGQGLNAREKQQILKVRRQAATNPSALAFLHGCVLAHEGRLQDAIAELKKAQGAQQANLPSLFRKLGDLYLKTDQIEEAESAFKRSLQLSPESHAGHYGLARALHRKGHHFEAASEALLSLEILPHNAAALFLYGQCLIGLGNYRQAETMLLRSLDCNPYAEPVRNRLISLYRGPLNSEKEALKHESELWVFRNKLARIREEGTHADEDPIPEFPQLPPMGEAHPVSGEVVIVSGLPRSGTSLMMQILGGAGYPLVSDGVRVADASNPEGYFEDERAKQLTTMENRDWLMACQGKALKLIAPLLPSLPDALNVAILFMERPAEEVLLSQQRMLERNEIAGSLSEPAELARVYARQIEQVRIWCEKRGRVRLLPVSYTGLIRHPEPILTRILSFLGCSVEPKELVRLIRPELHRERSDKK